MTLAARSAKIVGCLITLGGLCQAALSASAAWRSYTSPDYGFTIQYPRDVTFYAGRPDYKELTLLSYIPVCAETTVACFVYRGREYDGTTFQAAALSVNVLREWRSEQACQRIDTGQFPIKTTIINGIHFHYGMTGGGATSHFEGGPTYRTFYEGVCFELAIGITGTSIAAYDPGTIKEFDSTKLEKHFTAMVNTFKFIAHVVDGPAWRVYHNSMVGGTTFEYPDGDTVVKSIEYSEVTASSDEITDSTYFTDHGLNYEVATKVNLRDRSALDTWLKSAGYADLSAAREVTRSRYCVEYRAGNYYYFYGQTDLHILGVSGKNRHSVLPSNNPIFAHFLDSFRVD